MNNKGLEFNSRPLSYNYVTYSNWNYFFSKTELIAGDSLT